MDKEKNKRSNFYPTGEIIDYSLPQSFTKALHGQSCGDCGLYSNKWSFCGRWELKELRILMFAMIGEKDILRDKTINLYLCVIFMQHG